MKPAQAAARVGDVRSAALRIEATALRRMIGSAGAARRLLASPRALEGYWICLEVLAAAEEDTVITQKQLCAMAHGVWSAATLSRAVGELVEAGLIRRVNNPSDRRSPLLYPGDRVRILIERRTMETATMLGRLCSEGGFV